MVAGFTSWGPPHLQGPPVTFKQSSFSGHMHYSAVHIYIYVCSIPKPILSQAQYQLVIPFLPKLLNTTLLVLWQKGIGTIILENHRACHTQVWLYPTENSKKAYQTLNKFTLKCTECQINSHPCCTTHHRKCAKNHQFKSQNHYKVWKTMIVKLIHCISLIF